MCPSRSGATSASCGAGACQQLLLGRSALAGLLLILRAHFSGDVRPQAGLHERRSEGRPRTRMLGSGKPASRCELCDNGQRALDLIANLLTVIHNNVNIV